MVQHNEENDWSMTAQRKQIIPKGHFHFKHINTSLSLSLSIYMPSARRRSAFSCAKYSKQCVSWVSMFLTNRAARKNLLLK